MTTYHWPVSRLFLITRTNRILADMTVHDGVEQVHCELVPDPKCALRPYITRNDGSVEFISGTAFPLSVSRAFNEALARAEQELAVQ